MLFLGTTWQKQEGRFLLGSNSAYALGSTGGSSTITLTEANIPSHRHRVDSFTLTTQPHTHGYRNFQYMSGINIGNGGNGTNWVTSQTGEGGGQNTGTASPYTSYVGSGTAFNNLPPYLVVNIWKRLS